MKKWYVIYNGQQIGPMSENELLAYNLTPQTQVWQEGMPQWQPLYAFPELMAKINQQPNIPPTPGIPPVYKTSTTGKDKIAAGLLALFLGGFRIRVAVLTADFHYSFLLFNKLKKETHVAKYF